MSKPTKLIASEILNWEYLVKIAARFDDTIDLPAALADFAYNFTSSANDDVRNEMLTGLMKNGTDNQSKESAENLVRYVAQWLQTDHVKLRAFAKENGVRLKRG